MAGVVGRDYKDRMADRLLSSVRVLDRNSND